MPQSLAKWVPPGILAVNKQAKNPTEILDIPTLFEKIHELQLAVGIPPTPIPLLQGVGGDSDGSKQDPPTEPPPPEEPPPPPPPTSQPLSERLDDLTARIDDLAATVRALANHVNLTGLDAILGEPILVTPELVHIVPPIPITAIALAAAADDDGETIVIPAVAPGDLLVLADRAHSYGVIPASVIPAGFTLIANLNTSTRRFIVSFKIADAADSWRTIVGMNGGLDNCKELIAFRANTPILTATLGSPVGVITDGNPPGQTILAAGVPPALLALALYTSSDNVTSWTLSPTESGQRSHASQEIRVRWKSYPVGTTPQNVVLNMDDDHSANGLVGCYLRLTG